jgi:phosphate transport system protein
MPKHMFREIEKLKKSILLLSAHVERNVHDAVKAIEERDEKLARKVIDSDLEIDTMEVEIEEEALKLLALYQPVANVLRFIISVIKINNDLERIGDLAANISKRAVFLATHERVNIPFDFTAMARKALAMLKKSIDCLMNPDAKLAFAYQVCEEDDTVDDLNRRAFSEIKKAIQNDPANINGFMQLNSVARSIERIADHATNIAEDIIYMLEGEIVRHHPECRIDTEQEPY